MFPDVHERFHLQLDDLHESKIEEGGDTFPRNEIEFCLSFKWKRTSIE